ncbi:cytochrome P450 [Jannaschia donghaensis]|uniref:Biotin biosynthesis cytochrome P450 n=1 Tax=Jannaschia donghaensis TaxID=420998 RepID=A0A0M6YN24_9RHOB|nr:cytochrome P450 [Jannaschia donghaensis]CTQ51055.1 Biotin biosynthesis cytochrome P450 [Jannaschia donghaensis]
MHRFAQSPTDPAFVQDPYPFYDRLRDAGPLAFWADYDMPVAASHAAVSALLRDRRFGREDPFPPDRPAHQAGFWAIEDHSMLELEPPRHTALRGQVLRAFTSRRVAALAPEIETLSHDLIDAFPSGEFDLLDAFARPLPVRVIARLLGVPEDDAPLLLTWSNAMVGMYQARRTHADEVMAARAASDFAAYLRDIFRRPRPDSLIAQLLDVMGDGGLSIEEVTATCILLLNAGHEATVHTLGNGVAGLIQAGLWRDDITPDTVEEVLRHDPPLHVFTRYAMQDVTIFDHTFRRGEQVGLLLGAANRDPLAFPDPARFDPGRFPDAPMPTSFGAGLHFCLGALLARLELLHGLRALSTRRPDLRVSAAPQYADIYHFHGLAALMVE